MCKIAIFLFRIDSREQLACVNDIIELDQPQFVLVEAKGVKHSVDIVHNGMSEQRSLTFGIADYRSFQSWMIAFVSIQNEYFVLEGDLDNGGRLILFSFELVFAHYWFSINRHILSFIETLQKLKHLRGIGLHPFYICFIDIILHKTQLFFRILWTKVVSKERIRYKFKFYLSLGF